MAVENELRVGMCVGTYIHSRQSTSEAHVKIDETYVNINEAHMNGLA